MDSLETIITKAYEEKKLEGLDDHIRHLLSLLNKGEIRVAEKKEGQWQVNTWVKKGILLAFRLRSPTLITGAPGDGHWSDKILPKFTDWEQEDFTQNELRTVPGSYVRHGAYIGRNSILMPSFVNIGAYIGSGTMVDTWSTIGSCAQIGRNCHISGGVGIGGVLEPIQANPVIIEDDCFIGARSEVAEGVIVEQGSVISMGVFLGASTKIVNRQTGNISFGRIPPYSVVVPGSLPSQNGVSLSCAVIVKTVDAQTRSKTAINDLLRY